MATERRFYDNDNQVTTQAEYGRIGAHWVDAIMTAYSGNATTALVPQSTNTGVLSLLSTTTTTRNAAGRTSTMVYAQSNVPSALRTAGNFVTSEAISCSPARIQPFKGGLEVCISTDLPATDARDGRFGRFEANNVADAVPMFVAN